MKKPRLLFIPLHYDAKPRPHEDWFNALQEYFEAEYFKSYTNGVCMRYDYVFIQSGAIGKEILDILKRDNGCKIIQWTGDARAEVMENVTQYKGIADLTLLAVGIGQKEMYEKELGHRVEYMQQGVFDSFFMKPKELSEGKIVFIGNNYDHFEGAIERSQLCAELSKQFENFEVVGNGWDETVMNGNVPVGKYSNTRSCDYKDSAKIYNEAYISISHACFNDIEGYYSNRTLDIMAAGGYCLMRYTPKAEKYVGTIGVEFYYSNEDCIEKIKMLIEDRYKRNSIAEQGHKHAKSYDTFQSRAKELYDYTKTL